MRLGILGCGFSGRAIGHRLSDKGIEIWGTTRSDDKFPLLEQAGVYPVKFDGTTLSEKVLDALGTTTHLVVSIAPPRQENTAGPETPADTVLAALKTVGLYQCCPILQWVGYLSTVGVYGNHNGAWVDETTPANPVSERSRQRVRAENEWIQAGSANDVPVTVLRLSGIYGPGRNALVTATNGKSRRLVKPGQVFNRIHVDDIAQAIDHAANKSASGLFNISDDEPAPPQDVVSHAHALLGTTPPPGVGLCYCRPVTYGAQFLWREQEGIQCPVQAGTGNGISMAQLSHCIAKNAQ